jgi:hypothetical protein
MSQQMSNLDGPPRFWRIRKVFCDRIVEIELALSAQKHDAGRDKLFAERADLVDRLRHRACTEFQICDSVALHLHRLAVFQDG